MTLIAIHLLQNHAPSNLNRDQNGDPKDSVFGGERRARISSQALKRSIRRSEEFRAAVDPTLIGERSQWLPERVREQLATYSDLSDAERDKIVRQAARLGANTESDGEDDSAPDDVGDGAVRKYRTAQLMYLTDKEIVRLTAKLYQLRGNTVKRNNKVVAFGEWTGDEVAKAVGDKFEPHAVDIAMFGRMTTSSPLKDVEAAVQVAHAFSTHKIEPEFDFYTAVEDRPEPNALGAGFLGDTAFNSATYYKYFNIHWEGLLANLHNDHAVAATAVEALLRAAMTAIPTGKQNSFAAHNLPDFALVEVLPKNIPLSYANAFLKPVRAQRDDSLMDASITALTEYAEKLPAKYNLQTDRAVFAVQPYTLAGATDCADLNALAAWVAARVPQEA